MTNRIRALRDRFAEALAKEQTLRPLRQYFIDGELAWIVEERRLMLDLVNAVRMERGAEPVEIAAILMAELGAWGHTDYSGKFALFCASIVYREEGL